jgi:endoribonuclease Dicer
MAEQGNQGHNNIIMEVRKNEHKLKAFCAALPEDRKLTGSVFDMDHFLATERAHRVWKHPDTGAKLNYKMSLMVLANFVDSLPQSQDSNFQPEYCFTIQNKQFVCEVLLPERSPIRGAVGRPATTKQVAKCSAAFETCLDLIKGKYLNEWLLSTFTKQLPAMRNATLAVDSKKREAYSMRTKPALWGMRDFPRKLFVSTLILATADSLNRPSQPLALLTRDQLPQLPSFFLHFGAGRRSQAVCTSLNNAIVLTPELVNRINKFTLCLFDDVFSKLYESNPSKMPYFLVPIISHAQVDPDTNASDLIAWDVLKSVEEKLGLPENSGVSDAWCTKPDDFFQGKFIIDPYDGSRKMWSLGVTQKYKPLDPVPPNTAPRTGQRKNSHNIMEYSCSLWTKARAMRVFDPDQRVIEAEYISLRRNLLDEFDCSADESPKQCFLIMEPLKISPVGYIFINFQGVTNKSQLPITVVAMAYLLPAIIHRVESYLIALEAAELLHLNIHPDLALEAVTKNSENTDRRNQEQVNFQRGMGNNYERLEFLGDCFLKMATSISLYGLHPDNDEYRYHVDRMLLVCNKNLKDNAIRLKLYEYIRSQSFNRRAWYPDGLVLVKGKTTTAPVFHKLSDKSIADVCEAFIGAALLTFHKDKDMDNAVRAVTELVSSENHTVLRYTDYYKLYQKPKYQLAVSTESQLDLTRKLENKHPYHFHHPRLARSAFTHPSYPFSYEHVPSYQRLEFLGDALLDMACVNFLFHNFISKDPQWLTEHKMAMVSNQFLGALCVSLGFHTHLLVFSAHIQKQITVYVEDITEAQRQAEDDAVRSGKLRGDYARDFWIHVRQPPKCLPDIIEAYIGAIFVDSEYNYYEVERFFDMHIKWFFEDMSIYDTFANKHPANFLARFLQINMGCMDWSIIAREVPSVNGNNPTVVALVVIHGEIVADFQAESSRCAKIGGAKIAIELLSGLPLNDFKKKYDCRCILENDEEESEGGIYAHKFHGTAV